MSTPSSIALCITDLDAGGAEKALVQIARRLDRAVWDPVVYCLSQRSVLADELEQAGIPTHCLNAGPRDLLVILRLARLLRRQKPVLLQTFLFHGNLAGRLAAALAGVPVVVSGIRVAEREKTWHLRLERWTKGLVSHHVAVSRAVADFTEEQLKLRRSQLSVIANGVEVDPIASAAPADLGQLGIGSSSRVLLFVGRLHPQKGILGLIRVMRELVETERRDVHLVVAGAGPQESEARQLAAELGISERVHWLGRHSDVPSLMRASTLLVLPSLWEGMPNVVLEAMAAGLPVVASRIDGTAELVTPGLTGWLFEPGNEASLLEALRAALDSPDLWREFADRSQVTVRKHFSWNDAAAAYSRLWRTLIDRRR